MIAYILLVVLGIFAALYGVSSLTTATLGVGMVATACFLGIIARVVQAEIHEIVRRKKETHNA